MIEKIYVHDAGPLKNFEAVLTSANLVTGSNESGKTTLADLLASTISENLQGKNSLKEFHKITSTNPLRFGGEWNAEFKGRIDLVPAALAAKDSLVDISSLLVIRANKNEVVNKNSEGISSLDYWKSTVKRMIAGTDEIAKKIGTIRNYTNTGTRVWKIGEILSAYRETIVRKKSEFDAFRRNVAAVSDGTNEAEAVEKRLEDLKKARDAHEYGKRKKLYTRYMAVSGEIGSLEERLARYSVVELEKKSIEWECLEKSLKEKENRRVVFKGETEKITERKSALSKSLDEKKKRRDELARLVSDRKNKAALDAPEASERDKLEAERAEAERKGKRIPLIPLAVIILGLLSLAGIVFFLPVAIISAVLMLIGILLLLIARAGMRRDAEKRLREITDRIIEHESRKNAALMAIAAGEADASRMECELDNLRNAIECEETQLVETGKLVFSIAEQEKKAYDEIEATRGECSDFIAEFKDRIRLGGMIQELKTRERQLLQKKAEKTELEAEIRRAFGVDSVIPRDLLARVELESGLIDHAYIDTDYDPKLFDELAKKREAIMQREHSFDKQFTQMKTDALKELELSLRKTEEAASANMKEFYHLFFASIVNDLAVGSMYDLESAVERCDEAIKKIGMYKQYADFINEAVRDMESRLETVIRSVCNDRNFTRMVTRLMGYETVKAVIEDDSIEFTFGQKGYRLEDLSTGAIHQLNLVFRIALLKMVLAAPSTLILDDAFLHFDHERRIRACEILKDELVNEGWQFIYTAIDDNMIEKVFSSVFPKETLTHIKIR